MATSLRNPITKNSPCGPDLQYDSQYLILFAKIQPQEDVQYGDFIEKPEPLNWSEIDTQCQALLKKTKDISLYILYTRAKINLGTISPVVDSLNLFYDSLLNYETDIHPQLIIDGFKDEAIRANTFQALLDNNGFLHDIRQFNIVSKAGLNLTIKEVEQAYSIPKNNGKITETSIHKQIQALLTQRDDNLLNIIEAFKYIEKIINWCQTSLADFAPNFSVLAKLCQIFTNLNNTETISTAELKIANTKNSANKSNTTTKKKIATSQKTEIPKTQETIGVTMENPFENRQIMHDNIKTIRQWFEQNEPSSPVIILLKQAEKMIGKTFIDLIKIIPAETLAVLEQNNDN